jgi:hypothetical protein
MKVFLSQHDYIRGGSEDIHPFPTFKSGGTMFFHPSESGGGKLLKWTEK